jgi:hypothetical protein
MTAASLVFLLAALALGFLFLGLALGIGLAVRIIGDRMSDAITNTDHEMIEGNPL